jgi:hypothetical protein
MVAGAKQISYGTEKPIHFTQLILLFSFSDTRSIASSWRWFIQV